MGWQGTQVWATTMWPQGWPPLPRARRFLTCTAVRPRVIACVPMTSSCHTQPQRQTPVSPPAVRPGEEASPGVLVGELGLCHLAPSHRARGSEAPPPPLLWRPQGPQMGGLSLPPPRPQGPRMGGLSLPPPAPPASCHLPGSLPLEGSLWLAKPTAQTRCFPVCIFCAARTHIWNLAPRASD